MKLDIFASQSSNLFAENRLLKFVVAFLAAALMVNSFMVYRAVKYQKVVILPSKEAGPINFVRGRPNDEYTKGLVRDVVDLATTYTPATARQQFSKVLADYSPETYHAAQKAWYMLAGDVEAANTSSVFFIQRITLKGNTAKVFGDLQQFAGDVKFVNGTRTYIIRYRFLDGRFQILSFERQKTEAEKEKQ
jgi:conjugal transfer pilus assembly protein TraE